MDHSTHGFVALMGRLLLSQIFLSSGVMKIFGWSKVAAEMAEHGMPAVPFFLDAAIAVELGAGLLVLLGYRTRLAAWALFLFLIPVTAVFHDFWKKEGAEKQNQLQHFAKNVTIMGGLLTLAAAGAGRLSVDHLSERKRQWMKAGQTPRTLGARTELPQPVTH